MVIDFTIPNGIMKINVDTFFKEATRVKIRKMLKYFRDSSPEVEAVHGLKDCLQKKVDDEMRRNKEFSIKRTEEKIKLSVLEGHYEYLKTFCDDKEKLSQAKKKISNCKIRMRTALSSMNKAERMAERYKSILKDTYTILGWS